MRGEESSRELTSRVGCWGVDIGKSGDIGN